jgi:hypothetical protein
MKYALALRDTVYHVPCILILGQSTSHLAYVYLRSLQLYERTTHS